MLHSNRRFYCGMVLVIFEAKILVSEIKEVGYRRVKFHGGQWIGVSCQLQVSLLYMVLVQVYVTKGMYKIAYLQATNLGHHHGKQCIRGNVEWDTQEHIGAALV